MLATAKAKKPKSYAGPDRRVRDASVGSTIGFASLAAALEVAIILIAWLLGRGTIATQFDPATSMMVLSVAAFSITMCAGLVSLVRFATSKDRIALDVGVLMIVTALGWLIPRTLVPTFGGDWGSAGRAMSLGAACTILTLTLAVVFRAAIDQRLSVPRRLATVAMPLVIPPVAVSLLGHDFDGSVLRSLTLPLMALAAVVALTGGILRHRWLVAFLGMQFLGVQAAELFSLQAQDSADDLWLLSAALVSVAGACLGLYGVVVDIRQSMLGEKARTNNSWTEVQKARKIAQTEREANQNRMHSLRSGLLGVEAVAWTISGTTNQIDVGEILAIEVRRLRELTERSRLEITEFNLTEALDHLVVSKLRQGEALTLETPRALWIHAARAETVDAVHSLVDNAIRHAPGTPITISAGFSSDASHVEIRVRDRGQGVPVKMRDKIFKRGLTTHQDGTGIGLPVARMIAEAQGGELIFLPRLGGGSEFVMRLPLEPLRAERLFS